MPSSPVIFQNAEKFEESYNRQFGKSNFNIELITETIHELLKNKKFIYICIIIFIIVLYFMNKYLKRRKLNYKTGSYENDVNITQLLVYSLLLSLVIIFMIIIFVNKFDMIGGDEGI